MKQFLNVRMRLVCLAWVCALAGCAFGRPAGQLDLTSQTASGVNVTSRFQHAYYRYDNPNAITIVMIAGQVEHPTHAATIHLFWQPFAGYTPIAPAATNATIQYMVFSSAAQRSHNDHVAVYSGAGFLYLNNDPGGKTLDASLWQASLRLTDRSRDFTNHLSQSILRGEIRAVRDPSKVTKILHELSTQVTNGLGYPRLVRGESTAVPST